MEKSIKKVLLSIVSFFAVLCFGMGLATASTTPVQANTTIEVTSIKQMVFEGYASATWGYRAEYEFTFSQPIAPDATSGTVLASNYYNSNKPNLYQVNEANKGTTFNTEFTTFLSNLMINQYGTQGCAVSDIVGGGGDYTGASIYKTGDNSARLILGVPLGFAKFDVTADLSINGYTTVAQTFYQQKNGSFTTTEPTTLDVIGIYERPQNGNLIWWDIWLNKPITYGSWAWLADITFNGKNLTLDNSFISSWSSTGGHYDNYENCLAISLRIIPENLKAALKTDGSLNELTIPAGMDLGTGKIATTQTFVFSSDTEFQQWSSLKTLYEKSLSVTEVKQTNLEAHSGHQFGYRSEYHISFDKPILANYTGVLASNGTKFTTATPVADFTNFLAKATINGVAFSSTAGGAACYKVDDDTLCVVTGRPIGYGAIAIPGLYIGEYSTGATETFYEQSDFTFTRTAPTAPRINAVVQRPAWLNIGGTGYANYIQLEFWFNGNYSISSSAYTDTLKTFKINGVVLGDNVISSSYQWDAGASGYAVSLVMQPSYAAGFTAPITVEIPANTTFTTSSGTVTLEKEQVFSSTIALGTDWNNLSKFTELVKYSVTYVQGDNTLITSTGYTETVKGADLLASEKTFIGWKDESGNLYQEGDSIVMKSDMILTAVELDYSVQGVGVLIQSATADSGIRFSTKFLTAGIGDYITEFGTLITRTDIMTDGLGVDELTHPDEQVFSVEDLTIVVIKSTVQDVQGDYTVVTGALVNIINNDTESNYNKSFTSRGYMKIEYADGDTALIYTDMQTGTVAQIAATLKADADSYNSYSVEQQAIIDAYAAAYAN